MAYQQEPYREPLPKALDRPMTQDRFDDYVPPDYFWPTARWIFLLAVSLMGGSAIRDMYVIGYIWYLPYCWVSTLVAGYAGLALVEKYRAK